MRGIWFIQLEGIKKTYQNEMVFVRNLLRTHDDDKKYRGLR